MTNDLSRRDLLRSGVSAAALALWGVPEWAMPVLAEGETVVPFTDIPDTFKAVPSDIVRFFDLRTLQGAYTPRDQFFTTQHYGHPQVDPVAFRLKVTGLVDRPQSFTLDEVKRLGGAELVAGFECSGNSPRILEGYASNGRWTGVRLRTVLSKAGVKADAREFVFFGADHGEEDVEFRTQKFKVDQQYGRSLSREHALSGEPFLAYALNGEPLTKHQGFPLRLLVPGWYGMANVKWLSQIHVQREQYLGKFQARWYRTLRGETIDGEVKWKEAAITHMQLKSVVARVTRTGGPCVVHGFVLNDGTPIKSVEVRIDDGPWQPATFDAAAKSRFSWKLFSYTWSNPAPGEHTVVSRATDVHGTVQPTAEELANKKTFLEDNSQFRRKLVIS